MTVSLSELNRARRMVRAAVCAGLIGLLLAGCQSKERTATLLRLQFIDDTLLNSNDELLIANGNAVRGIHAQVEKNRRQPADTLVLRQAEAVHDATRALVDQLRRLRERLLRQTDNWQRFEHLDERQAVAALLQTGPPGARVADTLARRLRAHARLLQPLVPAASPLPSFDEAEMPVVGALAALAEREARALLLEETALAYLSRQVSSGTLTTRWRPMVTAQASTVAPGATYRAELMLARVLVSASPRLLTMTADGQPVALDSAGVGHVAFGAGAPRRATWQGRISYRNYGRDTTFRITVPYTVGPVK
ncbi:hypothetical protein LJ737_06980 [Hymenobacter sp. 15J16-1T3B]|uniref:hypothetical protein n=1 Tax=Hymenobacter sp. 15J16-1T3B TaxID=2886941 RepID=UPI001D12353D|nr:hypothetical protein [Hymenobacter sp. 15J16-1T3B]MCC3156974.1 hypothetical protein [Hymenobacter sp. 15J16-1T3B]